jgi:uncharacterized protein YndB with AHSA1/START domain
MTPILSLPRPSEFARRARNVLGAPTTIRTPIHITRSVEQVFSYITTSGNWPEWHPSSLAVRGVTSRPMGVGDKVVEDFQVAGRRGQVEWTVGECDPPKRWVIDGRIAGRATGGIITYMLTPRDGGTLFEREFVYAIPNLVFLALDRLFFRHRVLAESAEALRRLKRVLESS